MSKLIWLLAVTGVIDTGLTVREKLCDELFERDEYGTVDWQAYLMENLRCFDDYREGR